MENIRTNVNGCTPLTSKILTKHTLPREHIPCSFLESPVPIFYNENVEISAEKLTLEQLAEKCECSSKHIGDVERGTVSASWPLAVKIGKALNTGVDYYLADTSDQYFDIQIDVEISNILKDCDMETRMAIRDTARRIAEYGKKIQAKNK